MVGGSTLETYECLRKAVGDIFELYPTALSPSPNMIAVYLVVVYIGQIGYCVLLVLARKAETKVRNGKIIACILGLMTLKAHIDSWSWTASGLCQLGIGRVGRSMGQYLLLLTAYNTF